MTLEARGFAGIRARLASGRPALAAAFWTTAGTFRARPATYPAMRRCVRPRRSFRRTACCWKPTPPIFHPYPGAASATEPALTVFTARAVAEARGVAPEELWLACGENARRFFKLNQGVLALKMSDCSA